MPTKFPTSGKNNPCPVCDRTSDKDCRILEGGNLVLCHSYQDAGQNGENPINGYKFLHTSSKGAGWGVWASVKTRKVERQKPDTQEFIYRGADGKPFIKVVRKQFQGGKKSFSQVYWNPKTADWEKYRKTETGQWVSNLSEELRSELRSQIPIYRLPEVQDAIMNGQPIWWVEGESCADALWNIGLPATTTIGGSKGFLSYGQYYVKTLGDTALILCPDRDEEGIAYMEEVNANFPGIKQWCRVYPNSPLWDNIPKNHGLDIEDWLAEGADVSDLMSAIAPHWKLEEEQDSKSPDYDEVLDIVEELDERFEDQSRLDWELKNIAYDKGWAKRGLTASYLYRQMTARRDSEGELEIINAHDLMDEVGNGREWWIQGLIPRGTVIMLYARGGTGKTSFLHHLMKHVGTGSPWCGYRSFKTKPFMVQADEPRQDIGDKLQTARFFDLTRDDCMDFCTKWRFTQIRQLKRAIIRNGYGLTGIDSFTSANAGTGIELTKSNAGDPLYLLRNIASELNVTFIVIHHMNAAGGMRDSTTLNDNVSEVWKLYFPDKDDPARDQLSKNQLILDITKSRAGLRGRYVLEQEARDFSWIHRGPLEADMLMESVIEMVKVAHSQGRTEVSTKTVADMLKTEYDETELMLEQARRIGLLDSRWKVYDRADGSMGRFRVYFDLPFGDYPVEMETPKPVVESAPAATSTTTPATTEDEEEYIWT